MEKAKQYENNFNNFFLDVKKYLNLSENSIEVENATAEDLKLNDLFDTTKKNIHSSLCNSIDASSVINHLQLLILKTNDYINIKRSSINDNLINNILIYISKLYYIFGLDSSASDDDKIDSSQSSTKHI